MSEYQLTPMVDDAYSVAIDEIPFTNVSKMDADDQREANEACARHALTALRAYQDAIGATSDPLPSIITDLLSDIRHLCDALGVGFDELNMTGLDYYSAEIEGE